MTKIDISRIHFPVTVLGPGQRIGIWLQGCSIRCSGCISADTWSPNRGTTTVECVMRLIDPWLDSADGVTVSGGEPFDQLDSLAELLYHIRNKLLGDILVYSGYHFNDLTAALVKTDGLIDALISEPFEYTGARTLPLRGSDNQQLHLLTPLGEQRYIGYDQHLENQPGRLDIMFDDNGTVWFVGIPRKEDLGRFRTLLEKEGHHVILSEHTPGRGEE